MRISFNHKVRRLSHLKFLLGILVLLSTLPANASITDCLGDAVDLDTDPSTIRTSLAFSVSSVSANRGTFLIDTGSNISSIEKSTLPLDEQISPLALSRIEFLQTNASVININDLSFVDGKSPISGIIGTNLLSPFAFTFDFEHHKFYRSSFENFCSEERLKLAGFVPLTTKGYFSHYLDKLKKMSLLKTGEEYPKESVVPNIPTISVQIAGTAAVAQIDSGFNDNKATFSVNINDAFLKAVNARKKYLVKATEIPEMKLSTCKAGVFETVVAYRMRRGNKLGWLDSNGKDARKFNAVFFLKTATEATRSCGGIGTWGIPAAQLGISFLENLGTVIFNPETEKIWIPKKKHHFLIF